MADRTPRGGRRIEVRYLEADEGDAGQRIDNYLARHLRDLPRSRLYRLLRKGEVRVNGRRVRPEHRLAAGDRVRVPPMQVAEQAVPGAPSNALRRLASAAVIREDDDFLVIDKPAGVAVHGGSGVSFGIIEALRAERPALSELELVHRLDRDTSGVLLIAKRRAVLRNVHALLRDRDVEKRYTALLCGRWGLGRKDVRLPLVTNRRQGGERIVQVHPEGQEAHSQFAPLEHFGRTATLMTITIGTGRMHQIRVHAAYAGHPVAGDPKYGERTCNRELKAYGLDRMFLHAAAIAFEWPPESGQRFSAEAPLDEALSLVLERLRSG